MARTKKLNAQTLSEVGAPRLAELLLEASDNDQMLNRTLNLEVTSLKGTKELAKAVRKRLATIKRSRSVVDWDRISVLDKDLTIHLEAIEKKIAPADPQLAIDLLWEFLHTAVPVLDRILGRTDYIATTYSDCIKILGEVCSSNESEPSKAIENILECLDNNDYGQFDKLIVNIAPTLSVDAQNELKKELQERLSRESPKHRPGNPKIGFNYAESALMDLSDVQEDVDAYIALVEDFQRPNPLVAVPIAQRLLTANRATEALQFLEGSRVGHLNVSWFDAYISTLEALGRNADAQETRWTCFQRNLSKSHLQDYLSRLNEVEAFDAEEKALDYVESYENAPSSLTFLIGWPEYRRAANIVINRVQEFDGYLFEPTTRAAEVLSGSQPLAATLLLRSMIDFALETGNYRRYKHVARHLAECVRLADRITDYRGAPPHDSYVTGLKEVHGRKSSFWGHVSKHV